jgi:hypothetical protein
MTTSTTGSVGALPASSAKAPIIFPELTKAAQRFIWSLMFSGWEQRLGQAGTLFAVMDIGASG